MKKKILKQLPETVCLYSLPELFALSDNLDYVEYCIKTKTLPLIPKINHIDEYLEELSEYFSKEVIDKQRDELISLLKVRDKSTPDLDAYTNSTIITAYYTITSDIKGELGIQTDEYDELLNTLGDCTKELRVYFATEIYPLIHQYIVSVKNPTIVNITDNEDREICLKNLSIDVDCSKLKLNKYNTQKYVKRNSCSY